MKNSNEVIGVSDKKSDSKGSGSHSCCGGSGHQHHEVNSVNTGKGYQCPMKCEGDKTYKAPVNCPVCNMHLKPIN